MQTAAKDPLIKVTTLASTSNPQTLCFLALHQDYSSEPISHYKTSLTEAEYGELVVKRCLSHNHWGVIEHPSITLSCAYVPHSVLQQARTHRISVSFDCQSFRYTGKNLLAVNNTEDVEKIIYLRPVGTYRDRNGANYEYKQAERELDLCIALSAVRDYQRKLRMGVAEEHARGLLPFDYRQHFVVTFNPRSLLHFCDLRHKADAQLEIQWLAQGIFEQFSLWMPEIAAYYSKTRLNKGRLAP